MARKNKRSQTRKPQRTGGPPRTTRPAGLPPSTPTAIGPDGPASAPAPASATSSASARMVQRPLPRSRGGQAQGALPSDDASIPLERVPYFRADVRRIAITAALMFILLIAGSIALRGLLQA